MDTGRPHVLVVDDADGHLTGALARSLAGYDVDVTRDAFDAIYCIDGASRPYELIFCDLARGDLPGPELWAYLSITRSQAAARMVFVASGSLRPETIDFLAKTTNPFVQLPLRPVVARIEEHRVAGYKAPESVISEVS
jgi:hypothetical protein